MTKMKLHPIFGMLMYPTGGIVGAGNQSLLKGDMEHPVVIHAVAHDAFGYILKNHDVGPGYNYLKTKFTWSSTQSPLSCQFMGILTATRVLMKRKKRVRLKLKAKAKNAQIKSMYEEQKNG